MPLSSVDILRSAIATLEQNIIPAIETEYPKSLGLTLANVLRLVRVRLEQQSDDLKVSLDCVQLLLGSMRDHFSLSGAYETTSEIEKALSCADLGGGNASRSMESKLPVLHGALEGAMAKLRNDADPAAQALMEQAIEYLAQCHAREGRLLRLSFTGYRR